MTITKAVQDGVVTLALEGRLDAAAAPQLDAAIQDALPSAKALTLEMGSLVYVSSAGLRVILSAQKQMNWQGSMVLRHVSPSIMEVFDITVFSNILTFA